VALRTARTAFKNALFFYAKTYYSESNTHAHATNTNHTHTDIHSNYGGINTSLVFYLLFISFVYQRVSVLAYFEGHRSRQTLSQLIMKTSINTLEFMFHYCFI